MGKGLGLALGLMLAFSLSAAAEEVTGKVTAIDRANQSFVLDDGTRLSASESQLADLTLGDKVQAAYEVRADTKVVTGLNRLTRGTAWQWEETRGFGAVIGETIDRNQATD